MRGTVTVYFNTGFGGINIPKKPSVLFTAQSKVYPGIYYVREDLDKPYIVLKDSYSNLRDVDYVRLETIDENDATTICYYFAIPKADAKGTTTLYLSLDALTTLGGASELEYTSGWETRGHISKADDTLFGNTAAEDFVPSKPLLTVSAGEVNPATGVGTDIKPIISGINLTKLALNVADNEAEVIKGVLAGEPVMYLPKLTAPETRTKYYRQGSAVGGYATEFEWPSFAAYEGTGEITRNGLAKLFSFGQLQIQGSYAVPGKWVGGIGSESGASLPDGVFGKLYGITENVRTSVLYKIAGSYTPKNNKVHALYRNVTLANIGSGGMNTQPIYNLFKPGTAETEAIYVSMWSDLTPAGKPCARFKDILSDPYLYGDVVEGLQWMNSQLSFEGASGSLWNSIDAGMRQQSYSREEAKLNYELAKAAINTPREVAGELYRDPFATAARLGAGAIAGKFLAPGGINYGGTSNLDVGAQFSGGALAALQDTSVSQQFSRQELNQRINANRIGEIKSNAVVAPTNYFSPQPNLASYGLDGFAIYETRMQESDLVALDRYFQRYGYTGLNRPLTKDCFNARQYYTYVQAFDVNIKSTFGKRIREAAIAQLNAGVRAWAVLPDASYYELN